MASIVWCARACHRVQESRTDIVRAITNVRRQRDPRSPDVSYDMAGNEIHHAPLLEPPGFICVTELDSDHQRLLNIDHISSVEAMPGHGI